MKRYLLFYGRDDMRGGAHDFCGAHETADEAQEIGMQYVKDRGVISATRMHLARLGDDGSMRITHILNIPGGAYDNTGRWQWVKYK